MGMLIAIGAAQEEAESFEESNDNGLDNDFGGLDEGSDNGFGYHNYDWLNQEGVIYYYGEWDSHSWYYSTDAYPSYYWYYPMYGQWYYPKYNYTGYNRWYYPMYAYNW